MLGSRSAAGLRILTYGIGFTGLLLLPSISRAQFIKNNDAVEFSHFIDTADLRKHLAILASDEYEGRETGKKGQRLAADYLANHFKQLGLPKIGTDNSYFQEYDLLEEEWQSVTVRLNDKNYEFQKDFYCFHRSAQAGTILADEIIFMSYGIEDEAYNDYLKQDVKDKVILVLQGEPVSKTGKSHVTKSKSLSSWTFDWNKKARRAKEKGVKAILIIQNDVAARIERFGKHIKKSSLKLLHPNEEEGVNATCLYISKEMAGSIFDAANKDLDKIKRKINKKGKPQILSLPAKLEIVIKKEGKTIQAQNVLGFIEGSDMKEQVVVVTAHYDHIGHNDEEIFNGADDDGSGTVALMELAQAFSAAKEKGFSPKRSILFMPVSGEEKGLLGSKYYTDNPVFSLDNTIANLNIDMIGRVDEIHLDDSNYVYIIGSDFLSSELHHLNESANNTYVNLDLDYTFNKIDDPHRFYYRSDHYNFAKKDIPVIFYFNGTHADYHKATDTIEKINFEMLKRRTQLVFFTTWHLANREQRLKLDGATEE